MQILPLSLHGYMECILTLPVAIDGAVWECAAAALNAPESEQHAMASLALRVLDRLRTFTILCDRCRAAIRAGDLFAVVVVEQTDRHAADTPVYFQGEVGYVAVTQHYACCAAVN